MEKPYIIVASKMDIEDAEKKLKELEKSINQKVLPISSVTRFNIDKLLYLLKDEIHKIENVK